MSYAPSASTSDVLYWGFASILLAPQPRRSSPDLRRPVVKPAQMANIAPLPAPRVLDPPPQLPPREQAFSGSPLLVYSTGSSSATAAGPSAGAPGRGRDRGRRGDVRQCHRRCECRGRKAAVAARGGEFGNSGLVAVRLQGRPHRCLQGSRGAKSDGPGSGTRLAPAATPGSTAARVAVQPRALRDAGFMVYIGMCIFVSVYLLRRSYPDYFQQIATALPALLETPACSHLNTPAFSVHGEASH